MSFRFPVVFTTGVFETANPVAAGSRGRRRRPVSGRRDRGRRRRRGRARTPASSSASARYCVAHSDAIRLGGARAGGPGRRSVKNDPQHVDSIHGAIQARALCRHSYVIAVGGGAVLDVVGYAAATAHRGIRLIRVPTTVLSQDDSAVGVKNGDQRLRQEELLRHVRAAVRGDQRLRRSSRRCSTATGCGGVSEAVKVALIKDAGFFDDLERGAARWSRATRRPWSA